MANLFSHKLLHDTVKNITIPDMEEKITVLQSWFNAINNKSITKKTESECEQAFNLDIFHKVLGYSFYPTENYTLEAKGGNEVSGQKADATLGYFNTSEIDKNVSLVQVAVEIKDTNTPLTKSQRREGNLSPIQQGFKYKPQYNNCKRVLVTNFVEVRLFKDTQLDYEVWNLVDLVNPDNEYQNFKVFWYLLNAKHLIAPVGMESVTERLLSAVRIQSEQITKKFYQDYKTLRLELINDIRSKNPEVSLDIIIQKSQKVIDRIVFVHFCEDFGLLPDGKLAEVIQYSQSLVGVSIWQILSGFFEAVNSGSSKLGIPNGYNGGLFHEDKELNNLKIGDDICQKFVDLGKYDFQEELSVNILGHIFEQSISDLEDLRINMLGTELETGELGESTKSNKRKKDGIFYTPEYIVDYIVRNSLGKYLEEQFESIEKKYLKNEKQMSDKVYQEKQLLIYGDYKQVLENITVLDPACGSGAFLVKVFDYLLAEHKRVGEALGMGSLFDNESTYKSILQKNIYGVDLNAESVEITKLSLWLKTAEKGKKLADLDNNIKCGNSLISDPAVAGDKAFDWQTEFADIMHAGGFDVVVGNPPYLRIQGLKGSYPELTKYYENSYESATGKYDIYVLFIEQAHKLINDGGVVSFILPHKFLISDFGEGIRGIFAKNKHITSIIHFQQHLVFKDAATYTCILNIDKKPKEWFNFSHSNPLDITEGQIKRHTVQYSSLGKDKRLLGDFDKIKVFKKISKIPTTILDLTKGVYQGIVSTGDNIFMLRGEIKGGYFTGYSEALKKDITLESEIVKPILKGQDIKRYLNPNTDLYIIYPHYIDDNKKTICFEENDFKLKYPLAYEYLLNFKASLVEKKIKYKTNPKYWYGLHRSRDLDIFANNFLLTPQLQNYPNFTISFPNILADAGGYILIPNDGINHHYLLLILNSKLFRFYIKNTSSEYGGGYFYFKTKYISPFSCPKLEIKLQQPFIDKADLMLSLNKTLHEKIEFTLRFLQSKFAIDKPSTKLQKFREHDFATFIKNLGLKPQAKKKLPLDTEAELMRYFEKEKAEILTLKSQIDTVDKQIDNMVFDLYGLTKEERKVVLDG